ncbi:MAG: hypothetical protein JSS49_10850 [Planctomycetes bacterium]|nr:hypothetical protein [Planctomycetota bacterium]
MTYPVNKLHHRLWVSLCGRFDFIFRYPQSSAAVVPNARQDNTRSQLTDELPSGFFRAFPNLMADEIPPRFVRSNTGFWVVGELIEESAKF